MSWIRDPAVAQKILRHLGLISHAPPPGRLWSQRRDAEPERSCGRHPEVDGDEPPVLWDASDPDTWNAADPPVVWDVWDDSDDSDPAAAWDAAEPPAACA